MSPSLTWLINEGNRLTVNQSFNRDRFNGDGGLPGGGPGAYPISDLSHRFSTPYDFVRDDDWQSQILFNSVLSPNWQFRDGFSYRRTSDHYFVTEGRFSTTRRTMQSIAMRFSSTITGSRPILNQADLQGRIKFLGMTQYGVGEAGYEYE